MSRILLVLFLIPFKSLASTCFNIVPNHTYLLSSGVEYCLETKNHSIYIYNSELNLGIVEIADIDKTVFELLYPSEALEVPNEFIITSFEDIHLVEIDRVIYILSAPKIRSKRSLKPIKDIGVAIVSGLSGAAGSAAAGGDSFQAMPVIVGTAIGTGVGLATGPLAPVVGPAVGAAITQNIINNQNTPRPPLTIINTNAPISDRPPTNIPRPFPNNSGVSGAFGNGGGFGGAGGAGSVGNGSNTSNGGGSGGGCTSCHNKG